MQFHSAQSTQAFLPVYLYILVFCIHFVYSLYAQYIYICVIEFSARRFTDNCSVVPSLQSTGFPPSQRLYSPVEFASQLLGIACHKSSDNCLVYKNFLLTIRLRVQLQGFRSSRTYVSFIAKYHHPTNRSTLAGNTIHYS